MLPLPQLLTAYHQNHQAIPAFNIDSFEIYQAVEAAVAQTHLPAIVQLSPGEDKFIQAEKLFFLVKKARLENLPIYLNMDHGQDLLRLRQLARLNFDMLHFDGSNLDYQSNLNFTRQFVKEAKTFFPDILIEAEFDHINPVNTPLQSPVLTDPSRALEFATTTACDILAISVGNLHGVSTSVPESLNLGLLSQLYHQLPQTFLTLHGGSGISPDQISQAKNSGIVKVNINTDLRLKFKQSLTQSLSSTSSVKIYDILSPVISDLKELIKQKLIFLSTPSL